MPWSIIGNVVVALIPRLIGLVEKKKGSGQGAAKKSLVKEIILAAVEGVEGAVGLDIFNDKEVAKLYDQMNDSIVAFQNGVAKAKAKTPVVGQVAEKQISVMVGDQVVMSTSLG